MYYTAAAILFGAIALYFLWAWIWPTGNKATMTLPAPSQQVLFMSAALTTLDESIASLTTKVESRAIEIAKADGRFLVTPDDMKKAYYELVREECDNAPNPL